MLDAPIPEQFNIGVACTDAHLATATADRVAIVVEDEQCGVAQVTYAELAELTSRFAQALRELGIGVGERLLIRLPNALAYPVAFLGAMKAAVLPVPSSILLTADEVGYLLNDSGAAALITDPASWQALAPQLCATPALRHVILAGRGHPLRPAEPELLAAAPPRHPCVQVHRLSALLTEVTRWDPPYPTRAEDPAYLVYTSGTSGYPKGVLHAHRALLGRRPAMRYWFDFQGDDRVLHSGKLNWTYVLGTAMTDPLYMGQTAIVFEGKADATRWIPLAARHRATIFIGVPTVYRQILQKTSSTAADAPTLRHCMCAGEHLSDEVLAGWRARFGLDIYEAIGMSECSYYLSQQKGMPIRPGSVGKPQPGHIVALLGDDLQEVSPGVEGQIAIGEADPGLFLCYWNQPDETARLRRGGWFLTGDYARRDEDGYYWFLGRRDDIIKSFGYRVSPFEVERVLKDHPAVADCAVIGEEVGPDKVIVAAYVIPAAGKQPDADDIMRYAAQHLASYKCPRAVHFVADLPRTANGKVLRRALRQARSAAISP
ncbi:MAG: AMP-binding protein [Anaerolineae bacterium]|nr:AMP-binding protein [Anaerolineae bacterium]